MKILDTKTFLTTHQTFLSRGRRRTAQSPVCENNRTLVGNCLTCCIGSVAATIQAAIGLHWDIAQMVVAPDC